MLGLYDKRLKRGLILIVMLFVFTMVGYVFASRFQAPQETRVNEPAILGSFIMAVDVNDVVDLYAWQVVIAFNSEELMVLKVFPGDFLGG